MISAVILTKNESRDISRCLKSLGWCKKIHVVDSGSLDNTREQAQELGAIVYENTFVSFGQQRNWALDNCNLDTEWVLFLDADEVATDRFATSLQNACNTASEETAGFYCCWRMIWQDCWLKRCDSFPKWQFRVMRKGRARFADFGHGQKESEIVGTIKFINEPYDHYFMSKGLSHWVERHNKYSGEEALARSTAKFELMNIFSGSSSIRNPALKVLLTKIPGWPLLRFIWMYFFKLGFLEGSTGFAYCVLLANYEFLIKQKIVELKRQTERNL